MRYRKTLKRLAERIPPSIGKHTARIPHAWRLGGAYGRSKNEIGLFSALQPHEQREYIFEHVRHAVDKAYRVTPFYRRFYDLHGFHPNDIARFEDISDVPIVTKDDLQEHDLRGRSNRNPGAILMNTGGTSGQPLQFYVDSGAFAREWAHMHKAWSKVGYEPQLLKLTFRGGNLGERPLRYNAVHHEYLANTYCDPWRLHEAIEDVLSRYRIHFLHGYPSIIAEFAADIATRAPRLLRRLHQGLKGVLLGSEFPAPPYREAIERTFGVPTLSWYGHSEMAVFAYEEQAPYSYVPLHTYGYCEAVPAAAGGYRLIGTSYFNMASPFVRYDSGDIVHPTLTADGLLRSFCVTDGRVGEFVVDANGRRVSLTALIFGRHHPAFGRARFVQVKQDVPGRATLIITAPGDRNFTPAMWAREFDLTHVDVQFDFEITDQPIRSESGKAPLLLPGQQHDEAKSTGRPLGGGQAHGPYSR